MHGWQNSEKVLEVKKLCQLEILGKFECELNYFIDKKKKVDKNFENVC